MRKSYAGILLSVFMSASAFAGSSNPEDIAHENTKVFISSTTMGRAKCQSLAQQTAALEKCVSELKDAADRRFKLLPSALGLQSDAMKAAKDYYTTWQTSVDELPPKAGETQEAYASRQSASVAPLSELQTKLEAAVP